MFIKTEACTLLSHLKTYQKSSHAQLLFLLKLCGKGSLLFLTEGKDRSTGQLIKQTNKTPKTKPVWQIAAFCKLLLT